MIQLGKEGSLLNYLGMHNAVSLALDTVKLSNMQSHKYNMLHALEYW